MKLDYPDVLSAFANNECAIRRFLGQTHIYVPSKFREIISEEVYHNLALRVYGKDRLRDFSWEYCDFREGHDYAIVTLPSSLANSKCVNDSEFKKPDRFVELLNKLETGEI